MANPYTGHLVDGGLFEDLLKRQEKLKEEPPAAEKYEPVPEDLGPDARFELAGRRETYLDLDSNSRLARWAKRQRERQERGG